MSPEHLIALLSGAVFTPPPLLPPPSLPLSSVRSSFIMHAYFVACCSCRSSPAASAPDAPVARPPSAPMTAPMKGALAACALACLFVRVTFRRSNGVGKRLN